MTTTESSKNRLPRIVPWLFATAALLLLLGGVGGTFHVMLVVIGLAVITVGLLALVRKRLDVFAITGRRPAAGVLLVGVYLVVLGALVSTPSAEVVPTAVAAGDSCESVGTVYESDQEVYYCAPTDDDTLAWSDLDDYEEYKKSEDARREAQAAEEAQALANEEVQEVVSEYEEQLQQAEERATDAEDELAELQAHIEANARQQEEQRAEEEADQQPEAEPSTEPAPAPSTEAPSDSDVYYQNCTEAREAGAAPINRGEPGYAPHLDRDGDGVACE